MYSCLSKSLSSSKRSLHYGRLGVVAPGSANELSAHDRLILDLEKTSPSHRDREFLCERIGLPITRYSGVLDGLADTDVAYSYAPEVVTRVRRLRGERFAFERQQKRWRRLLG